MGWYCGYFQRLPPPPVRLISYLDDLIFAHSTARETLSAAIKMLHILPRFGWLVHPTKCQGVAEAIQRFIALGTMVCLASQTFSVPPTTVDRVERDGRALLSAPGPVECRAWPGNGPGSGA